MKKLSGDLIKTVQKLIDSGKGDSKRLHEIFNILKQGTPLYLSDYKYLQSLTSEIEKQKQKIEVNEKERRSKSKKQKKSETNKKTEKFQPKGDSALKILKNRLATGEISIEEFKTLKKVLKDDQ